MIEATIQNPEKLETLQTDSQGRVNLGVKFANRTVEIVVVNSEELPAEETAIQYTIGDGTAMDHERKGMRFVRTFGISPECLRDDHEAQVREGTVESSTVSPSDVNWSYGSLKDPKNVALFTFDESGEQEFRDLLTATPTSVDADEDSFDRPAYRFENENGDVSALAQEFVHNVQRVYGYDPITDSANVRVNPDDGPFPVVFRDPDGETYIAIAPMVGD